jgi:heme A synthase
VPIVLALMHQAGAILVLALVVVHAEQLIPRHRGVTGENRLTAAGANT